MGQFHDERFPGESDAYRAARDKLLAAEIDLRQKAADVTAMRQALPLGGALKTDYLFDEKVEGSTRRTHFSELFDTDKESLVVYDLMYAPGDELAPVLHQLA